MNNACGIVLLINERLECNVNVLIGLMNTFSCLLKMKGMSKTKSQI
jgi:hypothetical protein